MFQLIFKAFFLILTLQLTLQAREINLDNLIQTAKKSNKHLFLFLHKTDCGYCDSMIEFTLQNDTIKAFTDKSFIYEHINVYDKDHIRYKDFSGDGRQFAKSIGYDFYPTTLFFDNKSDIVFIEVGYRDNKLLPNENRFYRILNYIDSKSYKKMDYEDYEFKIEEELE
ncbi:MAG: thioredoxin family protein [Campylobacterota bacterium]|nr:thioredoxin family protein [Campylobacterota bacterium]